MLLKYEILSSLTGITNVITTKAYAKVLRWVFKFSPGAKTYKCKKIKPFKSKRDAA